MEQRQAEAGVSGLQIAGIVFVCMGVVFIPGGIIGFLFWLFSMPILSFFFLVMFGGIGMVLLIVGIVLLVCFKQQKESGNTLLQDGYYVMAKVERIYQNRWVHIWGKWPYVVECSYQDSQGNVYRFKSGNVMFDPHSVIKDDLIRVYVDKNNFSRYYVDIRKISDD